MIPTLAIDPGHDGAAVLLDPDGRTALAAWSWRRVQRDRCDAWLFRGARGHSLTVPDLHAVGERVRGEMLRPSVILVVEGLFGRGTTLERLSWYAGLVAGPVLSAAVGEVLRPMASEWRTAVLGIPANTEAKAASNAALRLVPPLVRGLGVLAHDEHVCEAAAIARWGWVARNHAMGPQGRPPYLGISKNGAYARIEKGLP